MHALVLSILVGSAAALSVHKPAKKCKRFVETLKSQGNGAAYMGKIYVGGQKMDAIWDTGSDEEVINSVNTLNMKSACKKNGGSKKNDCYDRGRSSNYKALATFPEKISYGSGDTYVLPGTDRVSFIKQKCATKKIKFQELISSDIPQLLSHTIDAVAGIGPMGWNKKQFLVQMGVQVFSFCFFSDIHKEGQVIWSDYAAKDQSAFHFTTMPNKGGDYWALQVTDWTMDPQDKGHGAERKLGCTGQECFCVVDTGTSLITLPKPVLKTFGEELNKFGEKSGLKCNNENIHKFPTLKFKLAGKEHYFRPQDYLVYAEASGDGPFGFDRRLLHFNHTTSPWLRTKLDLSAKVNKKDCVMMFTEPMGDGMCILGMPFFRNYMVTFDRNERSISTARHDGECKPAHESKHASESKPASESFRELPLAGNDKPKLIDASQFRVSSAYTNLLAAHKKGIDVMDFFRN